MKKSGRRGNDLPIPSGADPLVIWLLMSMNGDKIGAGQLSRASGVSLTSVELWSKGADPHISTLRAAINAMGYEIKLRRIQ